jgi:hypothetical protein
MVRSAASVAGNTKAKAKKTVIGVKFAGVSIGETTARIGISIDRELIELEAADDLFCNRRLIGQIEVEAGNDAEGQKKLVDDLNHTIKGAFDIKGFRVTSANIAAGLTFSLNDVELNELGHFAKRAGKLTIVNVEAIPGAEDGEDESETEDE